MTLGGLALAFTGVHAAGLLLDTYVQFSIVDLLVPFTARWRPAAVAWGVVAGYLLVAVEATSLARRRLPHRLWRRVHAAAFPLLAAATVHLLLAGSDRANPAVPAMLAATAATSAFLLVFRLLQRPRRSTPRRPPAATPPAGPAPGREREPVA